MVLGVSVEVFFLIDCVAEEVSVWLWLTTTGGVVMVWLELCLVSSCEKFHYEFDS